MQNENIILSTYSLDQLETVISNTVQRELSKLVPVNTPPKQTEFITRIETAQILGVSLPTLNEWTKKGTIKGYRIESRVRYKKDEILNSLTQVQSLKYGGSNK